ncbi:MAG: hypothetical protein IKV85_05685 [Ruminococcus sp.]|nr:hypothetical protein [Ruminococcus sp.]
MKSYKKLLMTAASAALCLAVTVPAVAFADEKTDVLYESANIAEIYSAEWVTDSDGRIFYYDEAGNMLTGEQEIDGEIYIFSKNGVLKTGWRTVNGKRLYFSPETGKPVYGRFTVCGEEFFILPDEGKLTDAIYKAENGDLYLVSEKGTFVSEEGRVEKDGDYYCVTENGTLAKGFTKIKDIPYIFDEDGKQKLGWVEDNGKEYYYDLTSGEIKLGLSIIDNSCYFIDINDGKMKGVVDIDGVEYYFSEETGQIQTGLLEINGNIKYFYDDGTYAVGVTEINGKNYLFNEDGTRVSGLNTVNGKLYYANDEGVVLNGRLKIGEDKYYFGEDYAAKSGLLEIDGAKYLFGSDFRMLTGNQEYNGDYYCFDTSNGKMLSGRLLIDEKKYYFSPETGKMMKGLIVLDDGTYYFGDDGAAVSGILEIEGKSYYFHVDSNLLTTGRLIVDGKKYYFDPADGGAMAKGWVTLDDGKYFFGDDGVMATGWQTIDENKYYFNETNGKMATNTVKDGYSINLDGVAGPFSEVQQRAQNVLNTYGNDIKSIYNFVCNNNKYRLIESTRTLAQINQAGWGYFANYALNNRFVVCYYFAAITDLLFRQAGYECRVVYGTGRGTGDHYWNQVYDPTSKTWLNYDTCNGYYGVSFAYLQTQNYTFKQYVYPTFY